MGPRGIPQLISSGRPDGISQQSHAFTRYTSIPAPILSTADVSTCLPVASVQSGHPSLRQGILCDGHKGAKTLIDYSLPPGICTVCHASRSPELPRSMKASISRRRGSAVNSSSPRSSASEFTRNREWPLTVHNEFPESSRHLLVRVEQFGGNDVSRPPGFRMPV